VAFIDSEKVKEAAIHSVGSKLSFVLNRYAGIVERYVLFICLHTTRDA
jgi:hypothetical protein